MFRFCVKWSLQIAGVSIVGFNLLSKQQQSDIKGAFKSVRNSYRASKILISSINDYRHSLQNIQYNTQQYHKKRSQVHTRVANRILQLSKVNKGIYMKLGQYIGNLDRMVPWQFTMVLKVLQDSAPSIPYQQIKIVIEEDLQLQPKKIFKKMNKQAFASASLAQVHDAQLLDGKRVAVKIQFPFLRSQTKWDLFVIKQIIRFCNSLMIWYNYKQVNLLSLFDTWTNSLVQQLDFQRQIANAQCTRLFFKHHPHLYIPIMYTQYSSPRIIVMEYIDGIKINQIQSIKKLGLSTQAIGQSLIDIFTQMIFVHGFVHCDAHPGNILIRKKPNKIKKELKNDFQIVLLDHGLYQELDKKFIKDLSKFWISLIHFNKNQIKKNAQALNIHQHYQYLPIIFLHRTLTSKKKLGQPITLQQKKYFRQKDIANFEAIHKIIQDMPPKLAFIIRAINLIANHNLNLGGTHRTRYIIFTNYALRVANQGQFGYLVGLCSFFIRLWIFQHFHWFYKMLFGVLT